MCYCPKPESIVSHNCGLPPVKPYISAAAMESYAKQGRARDKAEKRAFQIELNQSYNSPQLYPCPKVTPISVSPSFSSSAGGDYFLSKPEPPLDYWSKPKAEKPWWVNKPEADERFQLTHQISEWKTEAKAEKPWRKPSVLVEWKPSSEYKKPPTNAEILELMWKKEKPSTDSIQIDCFHVHNYPEVHSPYTIGAKVRDGKKTLGFLEVNRGVLTDHNEDVLHFVPNKSVPKPSDSGPTFSPWR